MATNLTAVFRLTDDISAKLDRISNNGKSIATQLEAAGNAADEAFSSATNGGVQAARSVDGVAQSATSASSAMNDASSAAEEMGKSLDETNHSADTAADGVEDFGDKSEQAGEKGEQFGKNSANAVQELSKTLAAAGIVKALEAIYNGFMDCSEASAVFEVSTAKILTIADTSQTSIAEISEAILEMSNDTGVAAEELSDAVYQALSAGVSTADAVSFAAKANELASGGFTSAATAVDVLTTAINAYGLKATDAENISDMLITAQNLGKTTVDELAQSVGKVIPLASAYNVKLDNLSTAYAVLTSNGVATAESGTYLKSMLNELGTSSSTAAKSLQEETGQSFAALMEQGYSLGDVLGILGESVDGDSTKFNELWSSTEAAVGALSLYNSGVDKFNSVLGQMQNSAGATAKAYDTMTSTTSHSLETMKTSAKNLETVVGKQLNPVLSELYDTGTAAFDWMGGFLEENPAVTAAITGLTVGGTALLAVITAMTIAEAAGTNGTIAYTVAHAALNAVMNANPVFLIITGVAALTAATVAFIAVLSKNQDEYDTWTRTTQKQYDELQNLNKEYNDACDTYGETSDEALALRYEVDELNDSFEANKQTVEEFTAEVEELCDANDKLISTYQESVKEINSTETGTLALIYKLKELGSQTSLTTGEQEQIKAIIDKLNESVPDLALNYDDVTNSLDATVASLQAMAKQQAEQQRYEESYSTYVDLLAKEAELQDAVSEADANLNAERKANGIYWDDEYQQWTNGIYAEGSLWANWTTNLDEYGDALKNSQAALAENQAQQQECIDTMEGYAEATTAAADKTVSYEDAVTTAINSVQDEMDELVVAYDKAYAAAKESLDGTVGLFDKVETKAGLSSQAVIEAWQSQIDFFNQYSDNLDKLENLGVDSDLLKELSDGSAESIAQVQALADELGNLDSSAASEAVNTINSKFGELTTAKETAATTMAEIQTDFSTKLDEIEQKLVNAIDGMNMETDAAAAAKKTMSAYTQAIKDNTSEAVTAAQAAANAVAAALKTGYTSNNTTGSTTGYASGTSSAKRGYAIVGEEGPEIVIFNGGETVVPADETERIMTSVTENNYYTTKATSMDNMRQTTKIPTELSDAFSGRNADGDRQSAQEKKITLEIAGKGQLEISGGMDKDTVIELIYEYLKPVLTETLKQEVYEEGELSYVY